MTARLRRPFAGHGLAESEGWPRLMTDFCRPVCYGALSRRPATRRTDSIEAEKSTAKDAKVRQGNAGKIEPRRHGEHDEEELRRVFSNSGLNFLLVVPVVSSWFNYLVFLGVTDCNVNTYDFCRQKATKRQKANRDRIRPKTDRHLARRTLSGIATKCPLLPRRRLLSRCRQATGTLPAASVLSPAMHGCKTATAVAQPRLRGSSAPHFAAVFPARIAMQRIGRGRAGISGFLLDSDSTVGKIIRLESARFPPHLHADQTRRTKANPRYSPATLWF